MRALTLHVMSFDGITVNGAHPIHTMKLFSNYGELFDQLVGDTAVVVSSACPRTFGLDVGFDKVEIMRSDANGPLRYTYSDEIAKVKTGPKTHPLDKALIGYFRALGKDREGKFMPVVIVCTD